MTTRHAPRTTETFVQLPLMGSVALYTRSAAADQLTPTRQAPPIDDLTSYAQELGFQEDHITVFQDDGTQASAPLMQREGYKGLLTAIQQGTVHILFMHTEERMFADAAETEVNTFIHLCMAKGMFVVTPHRIYDFQNLSHVALFRKHYATLQKG